MKILSIGAHQDDNEFEVGGSAIKWLNQGHEVRFLSLCNGCGGHHIMTPEETSARRYKESQKVAKFLGIQYDVFSDIDDCTIMPDLETRFRLVRYIREFNPDVVIAHRTNDYHADHRAAAQLVQDASYLLTVPHTCPDVPAMRFMPVIINNEDPFLNPPFTPDFVIDIDESIDKKLLIAHFNESQVYEWLPYTRDEAVPTNEEERFEWLKGANITKDTTDEEVMSLGRGYMVRYAKPAARYRNILIEKYGKERGSKVRFAEAFQLSEYGSKPSEEMIKELLY